jgi:hypothetical protein
MIAATSASEIVAAPPAKVGDEVSLLRLYVLRVTYLLLIVGLGAMIVRELVGHPVAVRGVIPSLLGAIWLLAFVGLRYPLQMLPLLLFEFTWKALWTVAYGLPQWWTHQLPSTFSEDAFNIGLGVIVMTIVIPWPYVWRHYVRQPSERWR